MFKTYNLNNNNLSIRNLILIFLTIALGFASVITLAEITIPTSINNARQTIARITITNDGTNIWKRIEFSSWGIFIDPAILTEQTSFSGKVLGLDASGNMIYANSENLIVSWAGGGGTPWWPHRSVQFNDNGVFSGSQHIYITWSTSNPDLRTRRIFSHNLILQNTAPSILFNNSSNGWYIGTPANLYQMYFATDGSVGINKANDEALSGKLHIKGTAQTELYLEETNAGSGANINLRNTVNTWMVWGFSSRFYIGLEGTSFTNITSGGDMVIGTNIILPKAKLQVVGNFIAGNYTNTINGTESSIAAGNENSITWNLSFIGGGKLNQNQSSISSIVWWEENNITGNGWRNFIWGGMANIIQNATTESSIVWWSTNNIQSSSDWFIGGGSTNMISNTSAGAIVWGNNNQILSSDNSFIWGWMSNKIELWKEFDGRYLTYNIIGGGILNTVKEAGLATIPWGWNNVIQWSVWSFSAGVQTRNNKDFTFMRNSDPSITFIAGNEGSFLINTYPLQEGKGWVGINTASPMATLHVSGHILWNSIKLLENITSSTCDNTNKWQIILSWSSFYGCAGHGIGRKKLDN